MFIGAAKILIKSRHFMQFSVPQTTQKKGRGAYHNDTGRTDFSKDNSIMDGLNRFYPSVVVNQAW